MIGRLASPHANALEMLEALDGGGGKHPVLGELAAPLAEG